MYKAGWRAGRLSAVPVAAGYAEIGDRDRVRHLDKKLVAGAVDEIHRLAEEALDRMKTSATAAPVILVGGGSVLIHRELSGVGELTVPRQAGVANAIGAAIAQVSGEVDRIFSYEKLGRGLALDGMRNFRPPAVAHPEALVLGYGTPPAHAFTTAVTRLCAILAA